MRIRYTRPASTDLDAILTYLTACSPQGARRVAAGIVATEKLLSRFPFSGRPTALPWLRRIGIASRSCTIFYEVTDDAIIIHALRHSARDPSSMPDVR